jgi:hypothetical protein
MLTHFAENQLQDGSEAVSLKGRPPSPTGTFLVVLYVTGCVPHRYTAAVRMTLIEIRDEFFGNLTLDLPPCSTVPQQHKKQTNKQTKSASELYRPSDHRLLAKLMPTFADRGCYVVNVTDPYGRILGFQDQSRYYFFHVAPQLYSRPSGPRSRPTASQKIW